LTCPSCKKRYEILHEDEYSRLIVPVEENDEEDPLEGAETCLDCEVVSFDVKFRPVPFPQDVRGRRDVVLLCSGCFAKRLNEIER
jgi:hypothetical protein